MNYILNERNEPVMVDWPQYAEWQKTLVPRHVKHVAETFIDREMPFSDRCLARLQGKETDIRVSTVFLGIDHNLGGDGGPVLFESMVFGGKLDQECSRYHDWDSAEYGHAKMVERVRATL